MKGLSSLERIILETIGRAQMNFDQVFHACGLHENVCFNLLQALVIRGLLQTDGARYKISEHISPRVMEEINCQESKQGEIFELIEAVVENQDNKVFRMQKIAMDERDEKIFKAMLINLDSFLQDAHKKAQGTVVMKDRKVVFWGMGQVNEIMNQLVRGA
jgi:hypothetical protein